jgi:hypothetical protein
MKSQFCMKAQGITMNKRSARALLGLCVLLPLCASAQGQASQEAASEPVNSTWRVQEITYSYFGFTTAYSCDAVEDKLKAILKTLGSHPSTKVKANGCSLGRPSRSFFVTITTATPIPVSDVPVPSSGEVARADLLKKLGTKSDFAAEEFPAAWKQIDLSRDRRLHLEPGDCELMQGLRDEILPKLGVKIEADSVRCTPKQVTPTTPQLKVSALVRMASPDAAGPATANPDATSPSAPESAAKEQKVPPGS